MVEAHPRTPEEQSLVGNPNEAIIIIEGYEANALLDTGSSVSTVSSLVFLSHLGHLNLEPVTSILSLECANGDALPFSGYIKAMLRIPELGDKAREKQLAKNGNRVAVIRSASREPVIVHSNQQTTIRGFLENTQPYQTTSALLQTHAYNSPDIDLTPQLISYDHSQSKFRQVDVTISNTSTHTVAINLRAILCEVQPVTITQLEDITETEQRGILDLLDIEYDRLNQERRTEVTQLIKEYDNIFSNSKHEKYIGLSSRVRHRIELHDE
ncbi:retropepsins domain-containing protein [Elysia marginata]|uniref:Retropepsins domain-containing protein n=1 Tax=Elysia marginata TaxID=1093978 RepID=A0AAV4HJ19_9GAST|nr:retropepsins domain-containing protein [Elysia marginata]